MEPPRLQVEKAITAALMEVTPANGYTFDLSVPGRVARGRRLFGDSDPLPLVTILEVPLPQDQIDSPRGADAREGPWELVIQGFVEDDSDHPTDPAHYLMHDVKRRLAREVARAADFETGAFGLPSIVDRFQIGPGVCRPADEVSPHAYFWLTLELWIIEQYEG